jgi:hypothetical protein
MSIFADQIGVAVDRNVGAVIRRVFGGRLIRRNIRERLRKIYVSKRERNQFVFGLLACSVRTIHVSHASASENRIFWHQEWHSLADLRV